MTNEFYEDDEAVADVIEAFDNGEKARTEGTHSLSETLVIPFIVLSDSARRGIEQTTASTETDTQMGDLVSA